MGNCLASNKVELQEEKYGKETIQRRSSLVRSTSNLSWPDQEVKLERVINEHGVQSSSKVGVARIKVVITKKELQKMLSNGKDSYHSLEQLVSAAMRLGDKGNDSREVVAIDGGINDGWKPALESIPEDHSLMAS